MKRTILVMMALMLLFGGTARAVPVEVAQGQLDIAADAYDGGECQLQLSEFHLLAGEEGGGYLLYADRALYRASAEALAEVLKGLQDVEIPTLGTLSTWKRGDKDDAVAPVQEALKSLGYLDGSVDGDFGKGTERAVTAFQAAMGLEQTGEADEICQLLLFSLTQQPKKIRIALDPEVAFAPLVGRTEVDLALLQEKGMVLEYDEIAGTGFLSSDEALIRWDASGKADLDKYEIAIRFGILTRENEAGGMDFQPVARVSCLCVRPPMLSALSVKCGSLRASAEGGETLLSQQGVYTLEELSLPLDDQMLKALSAAPDAGEMKLRLEGQYNTFDGEGSKEALGAIADVVALAAALQG